MPDLVVDTLALHGAAAALATVAQVAEALASEHGRAEVLVPAVGDIRATLAVDSFVSEWTYGAGWIANHARQSGAHLTTIAASYEAVEALLVAAAGGAPAALGPVPLPPPVVEPMRPVPPLRHGMQMMPVQLATARSVRDLIPGEPELVRELARRLIAFGDRLGDARIALSRISLGTWVGASADASAADLEELAARVRAAELAFFTAGDAVRPYAEAHAAAQEQAAQAMAMWQAAAPAAAILRGTAVGVLPPGAPEDPEGVLIRAGAMAREAREILTAAGRALAEAMDDAKRGAPNDPGFFSRLRRAVTSLVIGSAEGVVGMGEGVAAIVGLAVQINPLRAAYDPHGYLAAQDALYAGVGKALAHPGDVGAALIDLETWKDDPFRAAGKLVPDVLAVLATGGVMGAERGATTVGRVTSASDTVVAETLRGGRFEIGPEIASARVAELGLDPASAVGRAAVAQVQAPWLSVDRWTSTAFEPGHRFAIADANDIAVAVGDRLPYDAHYFYEGQQLPPFRSKLADGTVSQPHYFGSVDVYEVRAPIEGALARAESNPQFGEGGASLTYIPDLERAMDSGQVVWVGEHQFSPSTLESRIEDPKFRMADPELPLRALNPAEERLKGYLEGAATEATEGAKQTALIAGAAAASDYIDEGAR